MFGLTAGPSVVADGLRAWARGCYPDQAALELLIRAFDGQFACDGAPWIRPGARPGLYSLDPDKIETHAGGLSGGERRVLAVVAALAGDRPLRDLCGILAGVDRPHLALILAALAHAGGSHEHSEVIFTANHRVEFVDLPALIAWPSDPVGAVS